MRGMNLNTLKVLFASAMATAQDQSLFRAVMELQADPRAQVGLGGPAGKIVGVVVAVGVSVIVAAALFPAAFDTFFDANTTGWTSQTSTIWDVVPLIGVLVLLIAFIAMIIGRGRR